MGLVTPQVDALGRKRLGGGRTVWTGDSITAGSFDGAANRWGDCWPIHMTLASNGAIRPVWNAAHGGWNTTQLLAAFDAEVLAYAPNLVVIKAGTNDTLDGSNQPTTTVANITAMVNKARAAGADVALCTITPQGMAALPTPAAPTLTQQATGGTLTAATYRYVVATQNANGQTVASAVASTTVASGTTNSIVVDIAHVNGAMNHLVYRETSPGSGTYGLVQTVAVTYGILRWTDTGATPGAAPAGSNTTAYAYNTTAQTKISAINAWIRWYATQNSIPVIDMHAATVDPTTGLWKTGWTGDGTHPTPTALRVMGQTAWTALSSRIAPCQQPICLNNAEPTNLFPNGCLINGSASLPTGWASYAGVASGVTNTLGAKTGFLGNAFTSERTVSDIRYNDSGVTSGTISTGNKLLAVFRLQCESSEVGGGGVTVTVKSNTSRQVVRLDFRSADIGPGVWTSEFTAQAGETAFYWSLNLAGILKASIGQCTIVNLTALGFA